MTIPILRQRGSIHTYDMICRPGMVTHTTHTERERARSEQMIEREREVKGVH